MAGYLDNYGAGVDQRIRKIKIIVVSLIAAVIAGGILFYVFHNFREEQRVKKFFAALSNKDYKAAYGMFGCTDAKPCTAYAFDKFMEDFGPASGHDPSRVRIARSQSCGTGVILTVDYGQNRQDTLWVERKDMSIGFPPFGDVCPSGLAGR
jgi:hypothetical protein